MEAFDGVVVVVVDIFDDDVFDDDDEEFEEGMRESDCAATLFSRALRMASSFCAWVEFFMYAVVSRFTADISCCSRCSRTARS